MSWYLSPWGWHGFKFKLRRQAPGAPPASPLPKYWGLGQQSESYYPSFHIMIAVVVKFRTRPLRLIVTDIPPGVRRRVTRQTLSHWLQPQADSGSFKLRALIMPGVTQRWACARHRTSANNWDTTLYSAIAKNLKQISIIA